MVEEGKGQKKDTCQQKIESYNQNRTQYAIFLLLFQRQSTPD
jgi:hypothetical protein